MVFLSAKLEKPKDAKSRDERKSDSKRKGQKKDQPEGEQRTRRIFESGIRLSVHAFD